MRRFLFSTVFAGCLAYAGVVPAQAVRGLIVQLKPAAADAQGVPSERAQAMRERITAAVQETGLNLHSQRPLGNQLQALRLTRSLSTEELNATLRRLRLHPDVAEVTPDELLKRQDTLPGDPDFSRQWHLQTLANGGSAAINLPPAWSMTSGDSSTTIAVLDTGIVKTHPDLAGRFWDGYDFVSEVEFANDGDGRDADASDPGDWVTSTDTSSTVFASCGVANSSWHGTFIAGQIAATTNNSLGIAGINWGSKVLPVRVSGKCGALLSDVLDALRWAAGLPVAGVPANLHPARIINLSFGGSAPCNSIYQSVIDEITAAGALLVVAGGNNNSALTRPADCSNVLSVGSVQQDGLKTVYSSYGPTLGLMAPGGSGTTPELQIYSTTNTGLQGPATNAYGTNLGTSFSAPLASGVASLMLAVNPALTPSDLITRLRAAARPHVQVAGYPNCSNGSPSNQPCNCSTGNCGAGLLDAASALRLAVEPASSATTTPAAPPIAPAAPSTSTPPSSPAPSASSISADPSLPPVTPSTPGMTASPGNANDNPGSGGGTVGWLWGTCLWWLVGWSLLAARSRAERHSLRDLPS